MSQTLQFCVLLVFRSCYNYFNVEGLTCKVSFPVEVLGPRIFKQMRNSSPSPLSKQTTKMKTNENTLSQGLYGKYWHLDDVWPVFQCFPFELGKLCGFIFAVNTLPSNLTILQSCWELSLRMKGSNFTCCSDVMFQTCGALPVPWHCVRGSDAGASLWGDELCCSRKCDLISQCLVVLWIEKKALLKYQNVKFCFENLFHQNDNCYFSG